MRREQHIAATYLLEKFIRAQELCAVFPQRHFTRHDAAARRRTQSDEERHLRTACATLTAACNVLARSLEIGASGVASNPAKNAIHISFPKKYSDAGNAPDVGESPV